MFYLFFEEICDENFKKNIVHENNCFIFEKFKSIILKLIFKNMKLIEQLSLHIFFFKTLDVIY